MQIEGDDILLLRLRDIEARIRSLKARRLWVDDPPPPRPPAWVRALQAMPRCSRRPKKFAAQRQRRP